VCSGDISVQTATQSKLVNQLPEFEPLVAKVFVIFQQHKQLFQNIASQLNEFSMLNIKAVVSMKCNLYIKFLLYCLIYALHQPLSLAVIVYVAY
jgi:hypothetical protein